MKNQSSSYNPKCRDWEKCTSQIVIVRIAATIRSSLDRPKAQRAERPCGAGAFGGPAGASKSRGFPSGESAGRLSPDCLSGPLRERSCGVFIPLRPWTWPTHHNDDMNRSRKEYSVDSIDSARSLGT